MERFHLSSFLFLIRFFFFLQASEPPQEQGKSEVYIITHASCIIAYIKQALKACYEFKCNIKNVKPFLDWRWIVITSLLCLTSDYDRNTWPTVIKPKLNVIVQILQ